MDNFFGGEDAPKAADMDQQASLEAQLSAAFPGGGATAGGPSNGIRADS